MDRGKLAGAFLCFASLALSILFLWGIASGAYWAIAVPVALLVLVAMALLFWVGWTFFSTEPLSGAAPSDRDQSRPSRR